MANETKKLVLDIRQLEVANTSTLEHILSEVACHCTIVDPVNGKATLVIELTIESGVKEIVVTNNEGKEVETKNTVTSKSNFPLIYIENKIINKKGGAKELRLRFNFDEGVIDNLGSKPDGSVVSINIG